MFSTGAKKVADDDVIDLSVRVFGHWFSRSRNGIDHLFVEEASGLGEAESDAAPV
jgi:hypothetical protein